MLHHSTDITERGRGSAQGLKKSNISEVGMSGALETVFLFDALLSEIKLTSTYVIQIQAVCGLHG